MVQRSNRETGRRATHGSSIFVCVQSGGREKRDSTSLKLESVESRSHVKGRAQQPCLQSSVAVQQARDQGSPFTQRALLDMRSFAICISALLLLLHSSSALGSRVLPLQSTALQPLLVAPWFCHGIECPPFEVLEATEDYEVGRRPQEGGTHTESPLGRAAAYYRGGGRAGAGECDALSPSPAAESQAPLPPSCQVRRYSKGTWVSTTIETYAWALASSMGFKVRGLRVAAPRPTPPPEPAERPARCPCHPRFCRSASSATSTVATLRALRSP